MKIDLGNDILHLNRGALQHIKKQSAIGAPPKNVAGSTISTSMLSLDGFKELSALEKTTQTGYEIDIPFRVLNIGASTDLSVVMTGIKVDIASNPAEWESYVNPVEDADSYGEYYTKQIRRECYYVQRCQINMADNSVTILNPDEVRNTFFGYYEAYLNDLNEGRATGKYDEIEYQNRLQGLNKAYDNLLYRYAFTDARDSFHMFELCLNDIQTRFSNGDPGEGNEVYEERLAAWNKTFDSMIIGTQNYVSLRLGGMSYGQYEACYEDDPYRMIESSMLHSDIETMMNNAREHLLAGNPAFSITDDILNKNCKYMTADDFRFLMSKEFRDMEKELGDAITVYCRTPFDREQDKKVIEDVCADLIERIKLNEKIGDTLKRALTIRLIFAAEVLPNRFKRTLAASYPDFPKV